jgi:hypothetical protein
MYRDFGENIFIRKHVIVELERHGPDEVVVRFQFNRLDQGRHVAEQLREAADRMDKELTLWEQAQQDGKWL